MPSSAARRRVIRGGRTISPLGLRFEYGIKADPGESERPDRDLLGITGRPIDGRQKAFFAHPGVVVDLA